MLYLSHDFYPEFRIIAKKNLLKCKWDHLFSSLRLRWQRKRIVPPPPRPVSFMFLNILTLKSFPTSFLDINFWVLLVYCHDQSLCGNEQFWSDNNLFDEMPKRSQVLLSRMQRQ
ncbi:hypothetical protein VNO80_15721 [Phaseolus coccineus]|uniref:Uncharacterized protein n=1 Tax=Phaseolus coccineus TaxID=3886 RepID=A0AAN9R381_PHACN